MQCRMDGRVALVTGGSRGIGRAIVETFARAGADVAVVARRQEVLDQSCQEMAKATGKRILGYSGDVGRAADCAAVIAKAITDFGHIDVLVNNAGQHIRGPFLENTDELWQQDFDNKVMAAIRLARLVIPGMQQRKWGRILNVLSYPAKAPQAGGSPTQVQRATGMALTKVLASEFSPDNILVNALLTGNIVTDQIAGRYQRANMNISFEQHVINTGKTLPLRRMGTTQEYANMARFLASDAGSYITGTAINVDGGSSPVV